MQEGTHIILKEIYICFRFEITHQILRETRNMIILFLLDILFKHDYNGVHSSKIVDICA